MTKPLTWSEAVPRLVQVASRAPQKEAREFAMGQLMLLAEIVDRHIAQLAALRDALPDKEKQRACDHDWKQDPDVPLVDVCAKCGEERA